METNLEMAVHSIKTFHEQQKQLYEEFVRLRVKYDRLVSGSGYRKVHLHVMHTWIMNPRQKERTRSLLWDWIPKNCTGFEALPEVSEVPEDENYVAKYLLKEVVGQGQFAEVRKCTITSTDESYSGKKNDTEEKDMAIKIIDKFKITDVVAMRRIMNEIAALRELQSNHIFGLLDLIHTKDYLYLVTDIGGKDLFDYFEHLDGWALRDPLSFLSDLIRSSHFCVVSQLLFPLPGGLPEEKAKQIFVKIVSAVTHCHLNGFCHRDLKP